MKAIGLKLIELSDANFVSMTQTAFCFGDGMLGWTNGKQSNSADDKAGLPATAAPEESWVMWANYEQGKPFM